MATVFIFKDEYSQSIWRTITQGCMPCKNVTLDIACVILPLMHPFWEEEHILARSSQEGVGYPCVTQESSGQLLACHHLGVLASRSRPNCWAEYKRKDMFGSNNPIRPSCSNNIEASPAIRTKQISFFPLPLVQLFCLNIIHFFFELLSAF